MADVDTSPGSPKWWVVRLWNQLQVDAKRYEGLLSYQAGAHPLPDGHSRAREAYKKFQRRSRSNYVGLVTYSVVERMRPIGFRTGSKTMNELDAEAWRMWQANRFDARCPQLLLAACAASKAFVLVAPKAEDPSTPMWSVKDPRQTITEADPVTGLPRAGMTWWDDDATGKRTVALMLPDKLYTFTANIPRKASQFSANYFSQALTTDGEPVVEPNPFSPDIPLVPFVNRPDIEGCGMGEFEDVIDVQDRINRVTLDRLVIASMQAYRQRWAKGVQVEDENGVPRQPFTPGADLMWTVDAPDAAFGDFAATDLTPLLKAAEADVRDLAAITRTPPHYLMGEMVNVSGDALKAAESGLVSKVRERMLHFGEAFEQVMRLSFKLRGDELPVDAELLWANPEFRTISELYDAASKSVSAGEPWRTRMELLGHTPQEIERMEAQRTEDALLMSQYPVLEPPGTPVRVTQQAMTKGQIVGGDSASA